MGLTYGYDIYLRPQNVAGALAALTELAPPDPDGTPLHVTLPGGDRLTLPFTSDFGSAPVDCSGGGTLDLDTTLLFGLDDAVRAYADRPGYAPAADGRLEVGYIYATVRFTSAHHPGYASMEFWAATSAMSRLFERSATVRETFTGLAAAAGECAACSTSATAAPAKCAGSPVNRSGHRSAAPASRTWTRWSRPGRTPAPGERPRPGWCSSPRGPCARR